MDFLNKALAQLSELFKSMTPAARITAGLLLAVVGISLVYLFTVQVSGADCDLMNGEPVGASQLPGMKAAFAKAGLNSYEIRGTQILIPRGQRDRYMAALADGNALPPNIHAVLSKAVEDTSPFLSKQQQADRMKVGLQETLALIISSMRGIENAYVLYDTELKSGFRREKVTTASVSVKPEGNQQLDDSQVAAVRHLVAGAIANLQPQSVTVADLNGPIHYGGDPQSGGSARENLYVSLKRIHEQEWQAKAKNSLAYIPGVKVTANVSLHGNRLDRTNSVKHDPKPIAIKTSEESLETTRQGGGPGGRPGLAGQGAVLNASTSLAGTSSAGPNETESKTDSETVSVPSTTSTEQEKEPLTPQRVTVSVGIPNSYLEKIFTERNPPQDGQPPQPPDKNALATIATEVTTTIKETVANLLLPPEDPAEPATDLVTVKVFEDIQAAEIPAPSVGQSAIAWFGQYWSTLGMVGLALFSLVMLRSMVRATPGGGEPASAAAGPPAPGGEAEEESAEEAVLKRLGRFTGSGKSLRDELSELVQEDTEAAANILKTWIGSAG